MSIERKDKIKKIAIKRIWEKSKKEIVLKDRQFKIKPDKTLFNSKCFTFPKEYGDMLYRNNIKKGFIIIRNKAFKLHITAKYSHGDKTSAPTHYQAYVDGKGLRVLKYLFCSTYIGLQDNSFTPEDNSNEEEYLIVELKINNGIAYLGVREEVLTENKYVSYLRKNLMSNDLNLIKSKDKDKMELDKLTKFNSSWLEIEDLKDYSHIKRCVYTFIDIDKKFIYVGKANDLVTRLNTHIKESQKHKYSVQYGNKFNITHFRFDSMDDSTSEELLKLLEIDKIRTLASIFPNRSKCSQLIIPLIKDSEWTLINNQYKYH